LDAVGFKGVRTKSALFLLEIFLDSLETSTMQVAHVFPPILGSFEEQLLRRTQKDDDYIAIN